MCLREGSQTGALLAAMLLACAGLMVFGDRVLAGGSQHEQRRRIELPREVLPWRRDIEREADSLLYDARRSLAGDDGIAAERQLQALIRQFPNTHAADEGRAELYRLRERRLGAPSRRGLGMPLDQDASAVGQLFDLAPIAGWHTVVKPSYSDLNEALSEAAGDRVFFGDGSAKLTKQARSILRQQARWLKRHPEVKVRIIGHADDRGSDQRNMRLSHDRAVAVRNRLIAEGVPARRLRTLGRGRSEPIAICAVNTCGEQNRRVVTKISQAKSVKSAERTR